MESFSLKFRPYGSQSILINWPQKIDENILFDILNFKNIIQNNYIKLNVEVNFAYNSLLIYYNDTIDNIYDEILTLKALYLSKNGSIKTINYLWKIPVCYDADFGLDLDSISSNNKISKKDIIDCHTSTAYRVFFIGFLPGFLYLGGLDKNLHFPRLAEPRMKIKKGAVAIGGDQTGIYPNESPGGWNIIGNTPLNFFDPSASPPCFAKAGDKVQFYSVRFDQYQNIQESVNTGSYILESEVIDD